MSKRNWVSHAPIGVAGAIIVGLLALGGYNHRTRPIALPSQTEVRTADQEGGALADHAGNPQQIESAAFGPYTLAELDRRNDPSHPDYYEHQDLRAQESMARSTEALVFWTKVSLALGAVGALALFWTLAESRRMAKAALVMNDIARFEQRPWLAIRLSEGVAALDLQFQVQNYGKSPAFGVCVYFTEQEIVAGTKPTISDVNEFVACIRSKGEGVFDNTTLFPQAAPDIVGVRIGEEPGWGFIEAGRIIACVVYREQHSKMIYYTARAFVSGRHHLYRYVSGTDSMG